MIESVAPVTLGAAGLTIDDVIRVSRRFAPITLDPVTRHRVGLGRAVVETLLRKRVKVYGLTTGFASMRDRFIEPELASKLSLNLIRSHASGVGEPFPEDVTRAALLLRANTLACGNSGVGPELIDLLLRVLNARIYPYVPQQGSVGSSGDLAPLSHLMLAVIGDPLGRIYAHRRPRPSDRFVDWSDRRRVERGATADDDYVASARVDDFMPLTGNVRARFLSDVGLTEPYQLLAKEGLAGNNGAVFSAAVLTLAAHDATRLLGVAEVAAAFSHEALQAVADPLNANVVAARPHPGHHTAVAGIRRALDGSDLVRLDASCGFNMARFSQALMGLAALANDAHQELTVRSRLGDVVTRMIEVRGGIWDRIASERRNGSGAKDAEKVRELRACHRALAPVRQAWDALLDADAEPRLPEQLRRRLWKLDSDYLSRAVRAEDNPEVQDNYSFRAAATILGAARETVERVLAVVAVELNSSTDNPLVLLEPILKHYREDRSDHTTSLPLLDAFRSWLEDAWPVAADATLSAANFHGEPIGIAADQLGASLAEVGNIAERRVACLTDENHAKGLPAYLVWLPGLNSGFMIPQYAAAGLVTENRLMAMPAATDSIPTGGNCEDHVAMSTIAARRCATVLEGVERIIAIEILCAYQGVQFRKPCRLGKITAEVERLVAEEIQQVLFEQTAKVGSRPDEVCASIDDLRATLSDRTGLPVEAFATVAPCVVEDVVVYPLIEAVTSLIRRGDLGGLVDGNS